MKDALIHEAAGVIRRFLEGTGDEWEWDDFLSIPQSDPETSKIQGFCRQLHSDYPSSKRTEYCNEDGLHMLRRLLKKLDEVSNEQCVTDQITWNSPISIP